MFDAPVPAQTAAEPLSAEEVATLLAQLEPADLQKMQRWARLLGDRSGLDPEDLQQEAFARALSGSRKIGRIRDAVWAFIGIMRSLASNEIEAREGGLRPVAQPPEMLDLRADESLDPEELIISKRDNGQILKAVRKGLADDPALLNLIDAICDNLRGGALERRLGMTTNELATLRTRLKRRLSNLRHVFQAQQIDSL